MTDLTDLTIKEAREAMAAKKVSAIELAGAYIENIKKSSLNAYVTTTFNKAMIQAKAADEAYAKGTAGMLAGIPVGMKDLYCTEGVLTTASSKILSDFVPPYNSTVVNMMEKEGMVMLGKTNLDEFAMGSSTITSYYGATKNPWQRKDGKDIVPGGSSGGSAAAVSGGLALCATGTDTGGSIRQPASFCGVVGLKTTYGLCSRFGVVAFSSSLDTIGPMARTVEDTAIMLNAMAGYDPKDATSYNSPKIDYQKSITKDIKGKRIGIPKEYRPDTLDAEINNMWDEGIKWLEAAGAIVKEVSLPYTEYALPTYYIIAPAEASSNLARYDGVRYGLRIEGGTLDEMYANTRSQGFGKEVKRRILLGTHILSHECYQSHFLKALKVRRLIANDFAEVFKEVDYLLAPSAPTPAFAIDEANSIKPEDMYLNDIYTLPASLAGVPALSVPAAISSDGLPLGLQVIGRHFDEVGLLSLGAILEDNAGFDNRPSKIAGGAK